MFGLLIDMIHILSHIFFLYFIYNMDFDMDLSDLVKRAIKYLVEGLMVAIAAFAIPKRRIDLDEVALIALTAAATFSILDTYVPSMGVSARSGAGFGIGANLVGFPGGL
jgi:hypothetical protein